MDRKHEEEGDSVSGDDGALAAFAASSGLLIRNAPEGPQRFPAEWAGDVNWPTRMRNLRRAMIEQFEFEFMRLMNILQLKETIEKADVQALTEQLGKAVSELAAQNRSIISEEMAIREKATRNSLNLDT